MKLSRLVLAAVLPAAFFFIGCYAEPNESDVERVKQRFLVMRFHAPFTDEWSSMSDKDLFRLSCENSRIQCEPVLDYLKRNDTNFYANLMRD